jgi:membrane-associated protein
MELFDLFVQYLNPQEIIQLGGLFLLILIIFAETGLFFGFFLPGDSLLFAAGLFCGTPLLDSNLLVLLGALNLAAICGYFTSYIIGARLGNLFKNKKDSIFFKKQFIDISIDFYKKYGGLSIIVGRFFPIIRTFIPLVAGISQVNFKRFIIYNILGSFLWICSLVLTGFFIGKSFPGVFEYMEWIIVAICIISTVPVLVGYVKVKFKASKLRNSQ